MDWKRTLHSLRQRKMARPIWIANLSLVFNRESKPQSAVEPGSSMSGLKIPIRGEHNSLLEQSSKLLSIRTQKSLMQIIASVNKPTNSRLSSETLNRQSRTIAKITDQSHSKSKRHTSVTLRPTAHSTKPL